jgi:hypothetical protein
MRGIRNSYILEGNSEGRDHLENQVVDVNLSIHLKWCLRIFIGFIWIKIGTNSSQGGLSHMDLFNIVLRNSMYFH